MNSNQWQSHYAKEKSELSYPDENLVRLLSSYMKNRPSSVSTAAVDLGCGSGRHLKLLKDFNVDEIIGVDSSMNALSIAKKNKCGRLILCGNSALALKSESADIAIAWGSLHYSHKRELPVMINEIIRILKTGGRLFATLRSSRDSMLRTGVHLGDDVWKTSLADIAGATVSFFPEDEIKMYFAPFKKTEYGLIERTIIGDMKSRVSHWVIHAVK
ncbi:MAG: class I SAM-dependent methyltransferase [Spirochaetia bacterium]|jgi:ubiquinone/menaquinone biosynthesis C-methylase UbiE|nr:class I SAM-dependent methyltransferase [Spirochaetia bacterium]